MLSAESDIQSCSVGGEGNRSGRLRTNKRHSRMLTAVDTIRVRVSILQQLSRVPEAGLLLDPH